MPAQAGIKQAKYIVNLTKALGWRTNTMRTRTALKEGGIYPYVDKEKQALELFISQGHDLSHYTPIEAPAQAFHQQHYGKVTHHTTLVVKQQQLALASPSPTDQITEEMSEWNKKLIPRLAKLLNEADEVKAKRMAREILTANGYPCPKKGTWDDEQRALKIFKEQDISIDGFIYVNSEPSTQGNSHLPSNVRSMPPGQLKLEITRLQEKVHNLNADLAISNATLNQTAILLDQVVKTAYLDLDERRARDRDARLTDAELRADMQYRHLLKSFKG